MKVFEKRWNQKVSAPLEDVWHFFSRPENLQKITPQDMQFKIITAVSEMNIYQGMMIQYEVSPFPFFTTHWLTEITAVKDKAYFIDEQRSGPFRLWHHQHHFRATQEGTEMIDILHYAIPLGPLGQLVNELAVSRRIERIFTYRKSIIPRFFPDKVKSELGSSI